MNTPASNPFSGLKAALAGLLSGGWMGLVLHLLFHRRIASALAALENLFAQWQAGTLPPPAAPARSAPALPTRAHQARPGTVTRRRTAATARTPTARTAPRGRSVTFLAWHSPRHAHPAAPPAPRPHPVRCRKSRSHPPFQHAHFITFT